MRTFLALGLLGLVSCAGGQAPDAAAPTPAAAASAVRLEKSAESGTVDRVGASDGALAPDGTSDLAFLVETEGPVEALFLVAVDGADKPSGAFQADTLVGSAESPPELGAKPGAGTAGLGVFEDAKILNGGDGALQPVGPGPHRFTLYTASSPALVAGSRVRVYVQRPDKTLLASASVAN